LRFAESTGKPEHAPIAFLRYADPAVHGAAELARRRPVSSRSVDGVFASAQVLLLAFPSEEPAMTTARSQHSVSGCRNVGDRVAVTPQSLAPSSSGVGLACSEQSARPMPRADDNPMACEA
jgi:hypothetical protein